MEMNIAILNEMKEKATEAFLNTKPNGVVFSNNRTGERFPEPEGLCGFAWLIIQDNRSLLNWFKNNGVGRKHWRKGWSISVYDLVPNMPPHMSQSYDRKVAAVRAAIAVLKQHGATGNIWCEDRLD